MKIRPATIADSEIIGQIHVRSWQAAYRGQIPESVLERLDAEARGRMWRSILSAQEQSTWVAEDTDGVVGFLHLSKTRDKDDDSSQVAEVTAIYIHPDRWRQGVGRELLKRGLDRAQELGFGDVTLWVLETNLGPRAFYEAMGLRADGGEKVDDQLTEVPLREVRYRIRFPR